MSQAIDIQRRIEALRCSLSVMDAAQRHTGRTEYDLDQTPDGHTLIVSRSEVYHLRQEVSRKNRKVYIKVVSVDEFMRNPIVPNPGAYGYRLSHMFLDDIIAYELRSMEARLCQMLDDGQRRPARAPDLAPDLINAMMSVDMAKQQSMDRTMRFYLDKSSNGDPTKPTADD